MVGGGGYCCPTILIANTEHYVILVQIIGLHIAPLYKMNSIYLLY